MADSPELQEQNSGDEDAVRVPLAREHVHVSKREVTTGTVQVRTIVDVEQGLAEATLTEEFVEVTRVPMDRVVEEMPDVRTEGDLTIVPVVEEVAVVVKRLVLKEEVHIKRRMRTRDVAVPVELRRERAVVERLPGPEPGEES
jgi:stress response protein YsnF